MILFFLCGSPLLASARDSNKNTLSGIYYFENEVETFSPCKSNKTYWAVGNSELIDQLRSKALEKNGISGVLYLQIQGRYIGSSKDDESYARDFDGYFKIEKINRIRIADKKDCRIIATD